MKKASITIHLQYKIKFFYYAHQYQVHVYV